MKDIRSLFVSICVSGVLLFVAPMAFSQTVTEPNYEIAVHLVVGSNDSGSKGSIPANLNAISQQLRSRVGYSNFRLGGTIIGRMANKGDFEYKSYSDLFGEDPKFRSFLNLTVGGLQAGSDRALQMTTLRFGARVPVVVGYRKDTGGKEDPSISYEQIGFSASRLGIAENVPTLLGTLDVPNGTDMIFLVMTVKTIDR